MTKDVEDLLIAAVLAFLLAVSALLLVWAAEMRDQIDAAQTRERQAFTEMVTTRGKVKQDGPSPTP